MQEKILETLRDTCYETSCTAAERYGSFPLFNSDKWLESGFAKTLPEGIRSKIKKQGLRNGLLLSIAPTGTISMCADNISSGIEPPFSLSQRRLVNMPEGQREVLLQDYAYAMHGIKGRTAQEVSPQDHVKVLCSAQKYIDSAVSKTVNVIGEIEGRRKKGYLSYDKFKKLYIQAWKGGAKGCTTFNSSGSRSGILSNRGKDEGLACYVDQQTGARTCEA